MDKGKNQFAKEKTNNPQRNLTQSNMNLKIGFSYSAFFYFSSYYKCTVCCHELHKIS